MKKNVNAFNGNAKKATRVASVAKANAMAKAWFDAVESAAGDSIVYGDKKNEEVHITKVGYVHPRDYSTAGKSEEEIVALGDAAANDFEAITVYFDRELPRQVAVNRNDISEGVIPVMTNKFTCKLSALKAVCDNVTRRAINTCIVGTTVDYHNLQNILEGASVAVEYTAIKSGDMMRGTSYKYEHDFTKVALYGLEINDAIHASYEAEFADADAERREKVVADSTADLMARFLAARAARNEK